MKKKTNIIFDIAGVLADYRIKEFLADKGFDTAMVRRILKASVMSPFWGQFERGEITEEETLQGFASMDPEIERELRLSYSSVAGMLTTSPYAITLVQQLKKAGYGVYFLSNYSRKAYNECGESLAFMPCMDGGLVSFKVGITKPDPKMYQLFLEKYDLQAEDCIFVDDTSENVEVAKHLGFKGIVYTTYESLTTELEQFLVRIGNAWSNAV